MNGFLTNDFNRTGRAGVLINIGKSKKLGASRAISLDHNNRDRHEDSKGSSNISKNLRLSGPKDLRLSNRDNLRPKEDLKERSWGSSESGISWHRWVLSISICRAGMSFRYRKPRTATAKGPIGFHFDHSGSRVSVGS